MLGDTKYLRQRRGRWLVQIAVPKDLRERLGKANIERYLRTPSLSEAKRRKHAVVAEILDMFERARQRLPLTEDEIGQLGKEELARIYEALTGQPADGSNAIFEYLNAIVDEAQELEGLDYSALEPQARRLIDRVGAEPTAESVKKLCHALADAAFAAQAYWNKNIVPPDLPGPTVRRPRRGSAPKVSEAGERYLAERTRDSNASLSAQTVVQKRATFLLFTDFTGDARLDEIGPEDAAEFLDTLGRLHRHYGRPGDTKNLSLRELVERYPASDGEGLSNKTLNRHLSALSVLFKWARKTGLLPKDRPNPFSEQMRPVGDNPYLPFDVGELNRLFQGLTFEVQPKAHSLATARPWVMAVALFSGMRQGEVCDLDAEDVREQDRVPYFDITEAKSDAGVRRVPVHSQLVGLGFLDYVAATGRGPLFPGVSPGGPDGKRAHTFAKRFPAYRRPRDVDRHRTNFHSFRKCFIRALELAGIDRDRAALVVGHERGFTFRAYNPEGVDVELLQKVVEAVRYKGLKLPRSRRRRT